MPKVFTSKTQKTGEIGENVAVRFLMKHGFGILERNYTKKWGEIDIVARKGNNLHFIEVKSIESHKERVLKDMPENFDAYRPEDNMHPWKLKRLSRVIQTYLISNEDLSDLDWQVDLLVVFLNTETKKARIKVVKDIIL